MVASNGLGISVGDIIEAWDPDAMSEDASTRLRVVGVLSPEADVWGIGITEDPELDYRAVYSRVEGHVFGEDPLLLVNKGQLDQAERMTGNTGIELIVNGAALIMFDPEEQVNGLEEGLDYLYDPWNQGAVDSMEDLTVMRDNSIRYLKGKIFQYVLVFLCFFVLVFTGTVSISAIIALIQQREYAIFCLLGMEKREGWILQGAGFLSSICAAFLTAAGMTAALVRLHILNETVVRAGLIPALLCLAMASVCGAAGFAVPALMTGKTTIKEAVRGTKTG